MSGTYTNANGVSYAYTAPTATAAGSLTVSGPGLTSTTYTIPFLSGDVQTSAGTTTIGAGTATRNYFDVPTVTQTYSITGNSSATTTIHVGGTATINNGVAGLTGLIMDVDGGSDTYSTTGSGAVTVNLVDHGSFLIGSTQLSALSGSAVDYGVGGGTFVINAASSFVTFSGVSINGFSTAADLIDDKAIGFAGLTGYKIATSGSSETISFLDGTVTEGSVVVAGTGLANGTFTDAQSGPLTVANDGAGGLLFNPNTCFLRGSRIATPDGEVPVEQLAVGDDVSIRIDGATVSRPVIWVGRRSVEVSRIAGSLDAYPVRIRAHAFADQVPRRDLLVTAEHCVLVDGRLVPARMLVNGGSILVDTSIRRYEYFHVELERHAILLAEGLETESYMDTGNRGNFANAIPVSASPDFTVRPSHRSWAVDAAAPLAVDRATVQPIWQRLARRAAQLGQPGAGPAALLDDPDLQLMTETGLQIRPTLFDGRSYAFVVPAGVRSLRLCSRTARPSETIGPFVDDRRELGVLVGRIGLGIGRRRIALEAHLSPAALDGWHGVEAGSPYRWTRGHAALPLEPSMLGDEPAFLDIEVMHAGPYLAPAPAAALAA